MEGRLLLTDCAFIETDGRMRQGMSIRIQDTRIVQIAPKAALPILPGDWEASCAGRWVAPGRVEPVSVLESVLVPLADIPLPDAPARRRFLESCRTHLQPQERDVLVTYALARSAREGVTTVVDASLSSVPTPGPHCVPSWRPPTRIEEGAVADLLVTDWIPAVTASDKPVPNLGANAARVAWTVVAGEVLVREGQWLAVDFVELAGEAARAAESLFRRVGGAGA